MLNAGGIFGMRAAIEMLLEFGIENVSARLMQLKAHLVPRLKAAGVSDDVLRRITVDNPRRFRAFVPRRRRKG